MLSHEERGTGKGHSFGNAENLTAEMMTSDRRYTLGVKLGPLPLEEATFFLVTNCMVVQGALLFVRASEKVSGGGGGGGELKKVKGEGVVSSLWRAACRL